MYRLPRGRTIKSFGHPHVQKLSIVVVLFDTVVQCVQQFHPRPWKR